MAGFFDLDKKVDHLCSGTLAVDLSQGSAQTKASLCSAEFSIPGAVSGSDRSLVRQAHWPGQSAEQFGHVVQEPRYLWPIQRH